MNKKVNGGIFMDIQEQLKLSKQQLDEVQMYLQEQKLTEEDWMHAQTQSDLLDEQLRRDDGQFSFKTEKDFYMVTKLRLEKEIRELTEAVMKQQPIMEVKESAKEQDFPKETAEKRTGVFGKVASEIQKPVKTKAEQKAEAARIKAEQKAEAKRIKEEQKAAKARIKAEEKAKKEAAKAEKKGKAAPMEKPSLVQKYRLTRRQRDARLKLAEEQNAKWKQEFEEREVQVSEEMRQNPQKYGGAQSVPEVRVDVKYDDLISRYHAAGWRNLKGKKDDVDALPKLTEAEEQKELQEFMRELSNAGLIIGIEKNAKLGDVLQMNVSEFSKESILKILENRSSEAVEEFLKPLLEFDPKKFVKRYPIHKMTEKERIQLSQEIFEATHPYLAMIQWAEKFGEHVMTEELKQRYLIATQKFNLVSMWCSYIPLPVPNSFSEMYDLDICNIERSAGYTLHEGKLKTVAQETKRDICAQTPEVMMTEKDLGKYGITLQDFKYLAKINDTREENGYRCHLSQDILDKLGAGDLDLARELLQKVQGFSLITKEGRPRLAGDEPVEQLWEFGKEDLTYYAQISEAAVLLDIYRKKDKDSKTKNLKALGINGSEEKNMLKTQIQQAKNIYLAMKQRFEDPKKSFTQQRMVRIEDVNDANWFLRRQNAELDDYEKTHK